MTTTQIESAIYKGSVYHERFKPTKHKFVYDIYLFWLKLDESELNTLSENLTHFSIRKWARARFKRSDYLSDDGNPLKDAVLEKMASLNGNITLDGDVFMLGQLPWNERHYYLVDLSTQEDTPKAFHVSPFNPMDMTYQWRITQPSDRLSLVMDCVREDKEFCAGINLNKFTLDNANLTKVMRRIPSMTMKTVLGIYWQALMLFIKKTPLYTHPEKSQEK